MPLTGKKYLVVSKAKLSERPDQSWRETLRRWLVQCPNCFEVRLAVGARENDPYICKDCGHRFVIKHFVADIEKPGRSRINQSNS
jgi:rRNA maturation endonuclease Nob1